MDYNGAEIILAYTLFPLTFLENLKWEMKITEFHLPVQL
jgi:hypothetical protein